MPELTLPYEFDMKENKENPPVYGISNCSLFHILLPKLDFGVKEIRTILANSLLENKEIKGEIFTQSIGSEKDCDVLSKEQREDLEIFSYEVLSKVMFNSALHSTESSQFNEVKKKYGLEKGKDSLLVMETNKIKEVKWYCNSSVFVECEKEGCVYFSYGTKQNYFIQGMTIQEKVQKIENKEEEEVTQKDIVLVKERFPEIKINSIADLRKDYKVYFELFEDKEAENFYTIDKKEFMNKVKEITLN
eukprot:CAMPEP_0170520178 /NCGR_PEP_ID=MMETSP0209-20121228/5438_1 /TAXON_ID=665100 ORGANISM="Litonotus pictus, Strain P1" /NCGR_SAMPLE_ID=MMETSP0209 /ASSEMBLY_ACC=CAM_ASM_000301 /LENGTH=246 /DNA_ID=CAMNT_0010806337 /DNA_START=448 /DNA_END=1188 /DNA_ORIENTATION=-